jgi:hypothetical protein
MRSWEFQILGMIIETSVCTSAVSSWVFQMIGFSSCRKYLEILRLLEEKN